MAASGQRDWNHDSRQYESSKLGVVVVEGFQRLRQGSLLCDTQLVVQGQTFSVHRAYLASCSPYFYSMFTENFQEKSQNRVELKGVTAIGLRAVIEYAYTGAIVIHDGNLQDILEAADYLQFDEILTFCSSYITAVMCAENCLHFLNLAETYGLSDCVHETKSFVLRDFAALSRNSAGFRNISCDLLCELLSNDRLHTASELSVFNVAVSWLEALATRQDPETIRRVLGLVRYGLMSAKQMEGIVTNPLLAGEACHEVLQGAQEYHQNMFKQPESSMARLRAWEDCVVFLGVERNDKSYYPNMLVAPVQEMRRGFVDLCPSPRRRFASVAVVNDFVFLVGGEMEGDGILHTTTNSAFRYNPRDGQWLELSPMTVPRRRAVLVGTSTSLVVVGGQTNTEDLRSAEHYDFATNEWALIAQLPNTLCAHAGCVYSDHSSIYISGGCRATQFTEYPGHIPTNDVHFYDLDIGAWQRRASMTQSRCCHAMVAHGERLFVAGGFLRSIFVRTTEVYDVSSDTWSTVSRALHSQHWGPGILSDDSRIYILGGFHFGSDEDPNVDTLGCYDIERDRWHLVVTRLFRQPMLSATACRVKLPQRLLNAAVTLDH